jgi:hypothetical protein
MKALALAVGLHGSNLARSLRESRVGKSSDTPAVKFQWNHKVTGNLQFHLVQGGVEWTDCIPSHYRYMDI